MTLPSLNAGTITVTSGSNAAGALCGLDRKFFSVSAPRNTMRRIASTVQAKNSTDSAVQPQSRAYAMNASLLDSTRSLGGTDIASSSRLRPSSLSSETNS